MMRPAYASGMYVGQMPNAMHERTNELTNADASKTEDESHVSNAHERNPR